MVGVKQEPDVVDLLSDSSDEEESVVEVIDSAAPNPQGPPPQEEETWNSPYKYSADQVQPLPPDLAATKRFPIGCKCRVMHDEYSRSRCYITGEIVQVAFPWSERTTDFYQVQYDDGETSLEWWKVEDLEFAPGSQIWYYKDRTKDDGRKAAVVLGTEFYPAEEEEGLEMSAAVLHSIQIITGTRTIHHGIPSDNVSYRSPLDEIPPDEQQQQQQVLPKMEIKEEPGIKAEPAYS
ncbi:expressed unknown protein [Seminavis robusta]|uniref:Uncharacterized protein n=1 Tax=Seminavis robusta TaxID=568900 RepID=A0A9N8E3Y4_9STRA|nr:expressed unknown protein [Seminavis robusta]|eukprot:Sro594_g172520.1 n/a (235) ;mRNA; f:44777-45481